jgi:hypothetical protein
MWPGDYPIDWEYDGTKYVVTLGFREVFGRIEPVAMSVRLKDETEPRVLTKTVLRAVPVPLLVSEVLAKIRLFNELATESQDPVDNDEQLPDEYRASRDRFWDEAAKRAAALGELLTATGEGNGRRWGPEHYRQVLAVCAHADLWQEPRGKAVALAFGLKPDTAAKHIERAKKLAMKEDNADAPAPPKQRKRKT